MDTITHFIAGAIIPYGVSHIPRRPALVVASLVAGQLPDIDILWSSSTPEALLTLHRGISHSVFVLPFVALALTGLFYRYMQKRPLSAVAGDTLKRKCLGTASFFQVYLVVLISLFVHVFLDCMTMFGTQIFLPLSAMRVGLPAMFIIDPVFTVSAGLLLGLAVWRGQKIWAQCALLWLIAYPLFVFGMNVFWENNLQKTVAAQTFTHEYREGIHNTAGQGEQRSEDALAFERIFLQTEPFSPFVWKKAHDYGTYYSVQRWAIWPELRTFFGVVPVFSKGKEALAQTETVLYLNKPEAQLYARLSREIPIFYYFASFCPTMVVEERNNAAMEPFSQIQAFLHTPPIKSNEHKKSKKERILAFADMRYIPTLNGVLRHIGHTSTNFVLEIKLDEKDVLVAYRFLARSNLVETEWVTHEVPQ